MGGTNSWTYPVGSGSSTFSGLVMTIATSMDSFCRYFLIKEAIDRIVRLCGTSERNDCETSDHLIKHKIRQNESFNFPGHAVERYLKMRTILLSITLFLFP